MATEILDLPIKNGDVPYFVFRLPEGTQKRCAASQDAQEVGRSGGVGQTG
jgi:hypothetical protein